MLHPGFQWYKLQFRDPEIIETADMRRLVFSSSLCHDTESDKTTKKGTSGVGAQIGRGLQP
jgi:hypothetical protein